MRGEHIEHNYHSLVVGAHAIIGSSDRLWKSASSKRRSRTAATVCKQDQVETAAYSVRPDAIHYNLTR